MVEVVIKMFTGKILIFNQIKDQNIPRKDMLRNHGYEVASQSIDDYRKSRKFQINPHIILLKSANMETNLEIFQLCKDLKTNKKTANIPIIVLLSPETRDEKIKYIKIGVDDYLEIPYHDLEIILKINNKLRYINLEKKYYKTQKALGESLTTIKNQEMELNYNLTMATKIQETLIPKYLGNIPNCSFYWHFEPSGKVGGDIFDVFMLDEEHMGLYIIDVMGHGVASSMLAVALSEFLIWDIDRGSPLKRKVNHPPYYEIVSPLEVVNYLNKRFPFTKYQHYFTIFYMVLNVKTGVLKYVRAAHPMPILIKNSGEIIELNAYGTPVGFEFVEGYKEETIYLESGDNLIIYTDGLLELVGDDGEKLEHEGLMKYLKNEIKYKSPNHYFTHNLSYLAKKQDKIKDDLTILEMKWVKFI